MNAIQKLRQLVTEVNKGPASAMQAWPIVTRLLARMPLDAAEVKRVCDDRDPVGLDVLVTRLEHPDAEPAAETDPATEAVTDDEMKAALRAFNKRFKLGRLADESRLGGRYTSGGRESKIDAIQPPSEYPTRVWKALAAAGKLKYTGNGFYAPAE
ncbi:MAG: hypothetical protein Q9O74_06190 [Planctomycetota bacterium]|nr:hypothetical protein [Planctomycetota bacterium]